ncbi:MAG: hypothetical protein V1754_08525 [Pseudomonadota bacterium]
MRLICFELLLLVCVCWQARGGEPNDLFSNDRNVVLEYLKNHPVPDVPHADGLTGGPTPSMPEYKAEVKRAKELFIKGDPELRLAIAKSLYINTESCYDLWALCTDDDREAKHYLVGSCNSEKQRKDQLEWLRKKAHPSLASALIRWLFASYLYENSTTEEQDSLLEFLSQMYRQPGLVESLPKANEYFKVPSIRWCIRIANRLRRSGRVGRPFFDAPNVVRQTSSHGRSALQA